MISSFHTIQMIAITMDVPCSLFIYDFPVGRRFDISDFLSEDQGLLLPAGSISSAKVDEALEKLKQFKDSQRSGRSEYALEMIKR